MLTALRIKNLALVADLTLELQPGLNIITGETGAGKSILIGALNLVLGECADRTLIRSGNDSCTVEAAFDVSRLEIPLTEFLENNGLEACEDHQLLLKRTFTASGANRQFINGSPANLNVLSTVGQWLVDIHGPHDHQSLLHPARQLDILDAFGNLHAAREGFAQLLRRRAAFQAQKSALVVDEKAYAQQLDLLRFQTNEIDNAKLRADEEPQLEQDYHRANNAAKLLELAHEALQVLAETEQSLFNQAGALGRSLQQLQRIDPAAAPLTLTHEQVVNTLKELQAGLSRYADRVEIDPARLEQLEARLNLIQSLKRKYGSSLAEVLAFAEQARQKLQSLEQRDTELARLNSELREVEAQLLRQGQELSGQRRKLIGPLRKAVTRQLRDLGFQQSEFDIALSSQIDLSDLPPASAGLDLVEFLFAPNPGEPAHPLRAIASSGEMARVMLALKTVLAIEDQIPVLVFDEVDANIGGETANAVGEKMRQIAKQRQVLCITHLPQVAAHASAHYVVTKHVKAGRSISEIRTLDEAERVTELARMLGGQSEAARKHAAVLLQAAALPAK